ncbi:MAG: class II glutamine amidotransferase [Myxococcota bacterium]
MGRLLGYMANRADRLGDALYQERAVIAPPPSARTAAWGLGFYQGGEVLHKKRPLPETESLDWEEVAEELLTDCAIFHLRQATVGNFRAENTHPFRMRSWLFAHNGTIERFDRIRGPLVEQIPDFLRRNIRGDTDSEHFFHIILSFLHDTGQLDNPDGDERAVVGALRSAVTLVDRLSAEVGAPPATLNLVLTNGRRLFALRRGAPMMYVERRGLHETRGSDAPSKDSSSTLRYLLVVSDGPAVPSDYQSMADGDVVTVDRDLRVSMHQL